MLTGNFFKPTPAEKFLSTGSLKKGKQTHRMLAARPVSTSSTVEVAPKCNLSPPEKTSVPA
jgi:hypothetical protein